MTDQTLEERAQRLTKAFGPSISEALHALRKLQKSAKIAADDLNRLGDTPTNIPPFWVLQARQARPPRHHRR